MVIPLQRKGRVFPIGFLGALVEDASSELIVTVREDVCLDVDALSCEALDGEPAPIDLRCDVLDDYAS